MPSPGIRRFCPKQEGEKCTSTRSQKVTDFKICQHVFLASACICVLSLSNSLSLSSSLPPPTSLPTLLFCFAVPKTRNQICKHLQNQGLYRLKNSMIHSVMSVDVFLFQRLRFGPKQDCIVLGMTQFVSQCEAKCHPSTFLDFYSKESCYIIIALIKGE